MVAQFGYDLHLGRCPSSHTHNHEPGMAGRVTAAISLKETAQLTEYVLPGRVQE